MSDKDACPGHVVLEQDKSKKEQEDEDFFVDLEKQGDERTSIISSLGRGLFGLHRNPLVGSYSGATREGRRQESFLHSYFY